MCFPVQAHHKNNAQRKQRIKKMVNKHKKLTLVRRGVAEHVKVAQFVLAAVASETRPIVGATTRLSGYGDGILHCAIIQPAGVAPVQAALPGLNQLIIVGDHSILLHTGPHTFLEVQVVAARIGGVWEHNT